MIFIVFFSERERETAIARRESIISSLYKPKFFFFSLILDKVREREKLFENLQQRVKETWRT